MNASQNPHASSCRKNLSRFAALVVVAGALMVPAAQAVERVLKLEAPAKAAANTTVKVTVHASTDAGGNERIGFLHSDYSVDGGKTWTALAYEQDLDTATTRVYIVKTGIPGTKTMVYTRAAYRGGVAGDVDFKGGAIQWNGSWSSRNEPPGRSVTIEVGR